MSEPVTDEVLALKAEIESLKKQLMSQPAIAEPEIRSGFWYEEEQLPTYITKCGEYLSFFLQGPLLLPLNTQTVGFTSAPTPN